MENDPKQVTGIAPAGEDHTVISCCGTDFGPLEDRINLLSIDGLAQAFGVPPEFMLDTSYGSAEHFYGHHNKELRVLRSRFQQSLQDFVQQIMRSLEPVKRLMSKPRPTLKASSARKRKRALQSRYRYGRTTLTWVMPSVTTGCASSAQTHTSQVPKHSYCPTGRLNATSPAEQHIPKKTAGAADTLKSQEAQ